MGNTPLAVCEANQEEENHSTMNEDWTKEDLNRHLRDLLLHHGDDVSPPPRSVSIDERTPMVLLGSSTSTGTTTTGTSPNKATRTTEQDTVDDNDDALSQYKTPRELSPSSFHEPLLLSLPPLSNDCSMTTAAQAEQEEEVLLDEESMHFLFEDVVTTTTPSLLDEFLLSSGGRRRNNSNCFFVWYHYCSRLFRAFCLCFVLLWSLAREKISTLMLIQKPSRPSSSASFCSERSEQNQSLLPQVVVAAN
jgi:hypothetical protein